MFSNPVCMLAIAAVISSMALICSPVQAQSVDWPKSPIPSITTSPPSSYDTDTKGLPYSISESFGNYYSNGIYYNQLELFCQAPLEMSPETLVGSISSVRISPDLRQIEVRGDAVLGRHTAFALDRPHRLVVDFDKTSLGKVPSKIKLEKPPINEIRLDNLEDRARLVIDFGAYPVPPYAIERQDNMAVIALGETPFHGPLPKLENIQDSQSKPQKRHITNLMPDPIKNSAVPPALKASEDSLQSQYAVKKDIPSNDEILLTDLQGPQNPLQTYHLAVDPDLKDQTFKSVSLSSLNGKVKRSEMSGFTESGQSSNDRVSQVASGSVGPRKVGPSNTVHDSQPMGKLVKVFNPLPSNTSSIAPTEPPIAKNPFKMEGFKLQIKN